MPESKSNISDDQSRLTYLTRYCDDLQGMRRAPIYIAFPLLILYLKPPALLNDRESDIAGILALGMFVFAAIWFWLASRYYRNRFGQRSPRSNPRRTEVERWGSLLFIFGMCCWAIGFKVLASYYMPLLMAFLVFQTAFDSQNPKMRRIEYGTGGGLIAVSAVGGWVVHADTAMDAAVCFGTFCGVMLVLAFLDHLLLMSLRAPVREDADV